MLRFLRSSGRHVRGPFVGSVFFVIPAALLAQVPGALPVGGVVTAGSGVITQSGATLQVDQTSPRLVTQWQSFDIGSAATVRFAQPDTSSVALNRVVAGDASRIAGEIVANGRVFLVNPAGVVFAPGARVEVGGLVASSLQLSDEDFLADRYRFDGGSSAGAVVNSGRITAAEGGFVALLGSRAVNEGVVTATRGSVALAAGERATLDFDGGGLVRVAVDEAALRAGVENRGLVQADGGLVVMTVRTADALQASAVNNTGVVQARGLSVRGGRIVIDAGETGGAAIGGTLEVSNAAGVGGSIAATGGRIILDPGARLAATGATGGGVIQLGGEAHGGGTSPWAQSVVVSAGATLDASATAAGRGGEVVVWSDGRTQMDGAIAARGAGGARGGFVETSGRSLAVAGAVDAGRGGSWLLDPNDITISTVSANSVPAGGGTYAPGSTDTVLNTSINAALDAGNSITIQTTAGGVGGNGDITFAPGADITKSTGAPAMLTLSAARDIYLPAGVTVAGSDGAPLGVAFYADNDNAGGGAIVAAGAISTHGGDIWFGGGTAGTDGTDGFSSASGAPHGVADDASSGIVITGVLDAGGGNIVLRGLGNAAGGVAGNGIVFGAGASVGTGGTGTIAANGFATGSGKSGILLYGGSSVQTADGTLSLTGEAAAGAVDTAGLNQVGGTIASATGSITLTGARAGASYASLGLGGSVTSLFGAITLAADDLSASGAVQSAGELSVQPYGAGTSIGIGAGAGTLSLPQGLFWDGASGVFQNGFSGITIGRADGTGDITLGSLAYSDPLRLLNSGSATNAIVVDGVITDGAGDRAGALSVLAGGAVRMLPDAAITTHGEAVLFNAGTKDGYLVDMDAIRFAGISDPAHPISITTNGGNITLAGGTNGVGDAHATVVTTGSNYFRGVSGNTVNLAAGGGNITIFGIISGGGGQSGDGVTFAGSTFTTTGAGTISIEGYMGGSDTLNDSRGVYLKDMTVAADAGVTFIAGYNYAGGGNTQSGLIIDGATSITSASGSIWLTGTAGNSAAGSYGIDQRGGTFYLGTPAGGPVSTGDINLYTDTLNFAGTAQVEAFNELSVLPLNIDTTIGVGTGAGTLRLPQSLFWDGSSGAFRDGFIRITVGRGDGTGAITLGDLAYSDPLRLLNSGDAAAGITIDGVITDGAGSRAGALSAIAGGTVHMLADSSITTHGEPVLFNAGTKDGYVTDAEALRFVGVYDPAHPISITTNGGDIIMGGGTDGDGSGYATVVNTGSNNARGLSGNYVVLDAGGGSIALRGRVGAGGGSSDAVAFLGSTFRTTGNGMITIAGRMDGDSTLDDCWGAALLSTTVSTENGAIDISGLNNAGGSNRQSGVVFDGASAVTSATGAIDITGTGGNSSALSNGLEVRGGSLYVGTPSGGSPVASGNITLTADTMSFASASTVRSTGRLTVRPYSLGTTIGVGAGAGTLQLPQSLFWNGTSGVFQDGFDEIVVGRADGTGEIVVDGLTYSDVFTVINTGGSSADIRLLGWISDGVGALSGCFHAYAGRDLYVGGSATITSTVAGNSIVLSAPRNFLNLSGADALSTPGGRWIVYSHDPASDDFGTPALASGNTAVWGATYATLAPASVASGSRYVFAISPTVTVATTAATKTYGSTIDLSSNYTVTSSESSTYGGAIVADATPALTGTPTIASAGSAIGADVAGTPYAITVDLTGVTVASAYTLAGSNAGQLTVNPKTLTASLAGTVSKTYDGNTDATLAAGNYATLSGIVGSDVVTLNNPTAGSFDTKDVGTTKTVTVTGLALGGADAGNYTLSSTSANATIGAITAKTLTAAGFTAGNKVYDGATVAVLTGYTLTGLVSGEQLTLTGAAVFDTKNVGVAKNVAISGLALGNGSGGAASNYSLTTAGGTATADIVARGLTLTGLQVSDKVYDGTTAATIALGGAELTGGVAGDEVTLLSSGISGVFADKNGGANKAVVLGGVALGGADAGNYVLAPLGASSAAITPAPLTAVLIGSTRKVYDATTAAALTPANFALGGVLAGDAVALTTPANGRYATKEVGSAKMVTVGGVALGGTDAANYALSAAEAAGAIGEITPALLTYVAGAAKHTLGSAWPVLRGTVVGFLGADNLADATSGAATWTADAAIDAPGSYAIQGGGLTATNYTFTQASGNASALTVEASPPYVPVPSPSPVPPLSASEQLLVSVVDAGVGVSLVTDSDDHEAGSLAGSSVPVTKGDMPPPYQGVVRIDGHSAAVSITVGLRGELALIAEGGAAVERVGRGDLTVVRVDEAHGNEIVGYYQVRRHAGTITLVPVAHAAAGLLAEGVRDQTLATILTLSSPGGREIDCSVFFRDGTMSMYLPASPGDGAALMPDVRQLALLGLYAIETKLSVSPDAVRTAYVHRE